MHTCNAEIQKKSGQTVPILKKTTGLGPSRYMIYLCLAAMISLPEGPVQSSFSPSAGQMKNRSQLYMKPLSRNWATTLPALHPHLFIHMAMAFGQSYCKDNIHNIPVEAMKDDTIYVVHQYSMSVVYIIPEYVYIYVH